MKVKNEYLLSSADKMRALQEKSKVWSLRIQERNSDMFFSFFENEQQRNGFIGY